MKTSELKRMTKKPKKLETAWNQIDRRAKWYGMNRKQYLDAFFNRFNCHDDLKTELAIERVMDEEKIILNGMC